MNFLQFLAATIITIKIIQEINNPDVYWYQPPTTLPPNPKDTAKESGESFEAVWDRTLKKPIELPPLPNSDEIWRQTMGELFSPKSNQLVEASKWLSIIKHPCVVLILGKRGSGKSALAYRIIEDLRWTADIYAVGLPDSANQYIPEWITIQPEIEDVPPNSVIVIDETHLKFHSGSGMKSTSIALTRILNLSRQRNQTFIFVSQESSQIDRNIFSAIDVTIFKEPSMFQAKFTRPELRDLSSQSEKAFQSVSGDKNKWSFVFSQEQGCVGLIESPLPSFWNNKLSRAFASSVASRPKLGKKLTRSERQAEAKRLAALGNKPAQIARIMGLSKATIKNYLDDYPYTRHSDKGNLAD